MEAKIALAFSVPIGELDTLRTSFALASRRASASDAVANHHIDQQPDEVLRNGFVTLVKKEEF